MIRFGQPRFHFESVGSTQTLALDSARQGGVPGTAFTAVDQTAGRGRRGRVWNAPPGANVNLSVLGESIPPERLWQLAPLTAVCVQDALRQCFPALDARLRFPNDVICQGRKLAGVLVEATAHGDAVIPVVGIGVNIRSADVPPEIQSIFGAVEDFPAGQGVDADSVEQVTNALFAALSQWWGTLRDTGLDSVIEAWNEGLDRNSEREFRLGDAQFRARVGGLTRDGRVELFPVTGGRLRVSVAEVVLGDA